MKAFDIIFYCKSERSGRRFSYIETSVFEDQLQDYFHKLSEKLGQTFEGGTDGFFYTVLDIEYKEINYEKVPH